MRAEGDTGPLNLPGTDKRKFFDVTAQFSCLEEKREKICLAGRVSLPSQSQPGWTDARMHSARCDLFFLKTAGGEIGLSAPWQPDLLLL